MATTQGKFSLLQDVLDHPEIPISEKLEKLEGLLTLLSTPLVLSSKTYTADGAADMTKTIHILGSGVDITGFDPAYVGQIAILYCPDSTANATADCTSATWEGTNDLATFADNEDGLLVVAVSLTRWLVLANLGAVGFS